MARTWSCGFELGSVIDGVEWDGTGGAPSISTTTVRSGRASLRCNPTAGTAYLQHRVASADTGPWWARAYVYVDTLPDADVNLIEAVDDANLVVASIRLTTTGTLQLHDEHETLVGASQIGSDSSALTTGEWHRVDLGIRPLGYGGEARLDEEAFASTPGTELVTGEHLTRFRFGAITTVTCDLYLDDLAVNGEASAPDVLLSNTFDGTDEDAVTVANSGNHGDAFDTVDSTGVTYDADGAYRGAASLRLDDASSSNGVAWGGLSLTDCAMRIYVNRGTSDSGNIWWSPGPGTASLGADGDVTWDALTIADALPASTWCRVEVTREGDQGTLRVWSTDPESTGTPDAETSGTIDDSEITQWWLEHMGDAIWLDDWAIRDGATEIGPAANPDYPGEGRIIHLRPTAAGDNNEWRGVDGQTAVSGDETSWQRVDEAPPDGDTYAYWADTDAAVDEFGITVPSEVLATDTITLVSVGARVGSHSASGTRDLAVRLRASAAGSVTTGSTIDAAVQGWATNGVATPMLYTLTSTTNPETSSAWEPDELDEVQIGYTTVTSTGLIRRVTAVWALVEYARGEESPPPEGNADVVGAESDVPGMPTVIAEASFTADAQDPLALHLDDEDRGILDTNTLAGELAFSDISRYVRSASTSRGSDRITDPVISYDAGTATLVLDNSDRRFDPTNLDGPYVSAGRSQVSPMRQMRLRARWGSTTNFVVNPSFEGGSTDGWTSNNETSLATSTEVTPPYGTYALEVTRTGSNAFEVHNAATDGSEGFSGGRIGEGVQVTISAYVYIPPEVYDQVDDVAIVGGSGDISQNAIDSTFVGKPAEPGIWERVSLTDTVNTDTVLYDVQVGIWTDGTITTGTAVGYIDAVQCVLGAEPEDFEPHERVYDLLRGFADKWDVAWSDPNDSTSTVQFSDAFKVFAGRDLAAADSPLGSGEDSGARVSRILDEIEWPDGDRDIATGDTTLQATDLEGAVLDQLQAVGQTEIGELYMSGAGKVVFRNRTALHTEARSVHPQAVFGDRAGEIRYNTVEINADDATLANLVTITREGGTEQTAQDSESQAEFLTRTYNQSSLLMETDEVAADYAQFILYQSAEPELRFEQLVLHPLRKPGVLMPLALGLEIGDRIRIRRRPPGGGQRIERDCFVRGVSHEITPAWWETTLSLQSATKGAFMVLDDPVLGQLDANALGY